MPFILLLPVRDTGDSVLDSWLWHFVEHSC